jgi:N-acetylglucosaminyl-diphospho-decaprenol L-rhamnosyltransferase
VVSAPCVTATIVSWNTRDLLRGCLASLHHEQTDGTVAVHVVDNASSDGSVDMVRHEHPWARLTANPSNVGFAAACNQSWQEAQGDFWLLLNPDAELRPGSIARLVDFMRTHPRVGLATAKVVNPDGSPQYCACHRPSVWRTLLETSRLPKLLGRELRGRLLMGPYWSYDRSRPVGWAWGTALVARREAVQDVGPLCEDFFMYGEDVEWCLRMQRAGWEVWFCAEAEALHYGSQSALRAWQDEERAWRVLDGYYQAVGRHYGRMHAGAIERADLIAAWIETAMARLRNRPSTALAASVRLRERRLAGRDRSAQA